MLNLDFSVCDCRQLAVRDREIRGKASRSFGGIIGLGDVQLLPLLYVPQEEREPKELMLTACLTMMRLDNLRPMGINSDYLASDFPTIVSSLEAALLPGTVVHMDISGDAFRVEQLVKAGHIVVDAAARLVRGIEIGEDGLHVYKRLLEGMCMSSREAAWGVRCLRKMLGSWNPLVRVGHADAEHENERDEAHYSLQLEDCVVQQPTSTLEGVLELYFQGASLGRGSYDCLLQHAGDVWVHPGNSLRLPPCAKAVVLDDVSRSAKIFSSRRSGVAAAYRAVYPQIPTPDHIRNDMRDLEKLLSRVCFKNAPMGSTMAWHNAQIAYLTRVRRRPGLARTQHDSQSGKTSVGLQKKPAAGNNFARLVRTQCENVTVHGILASFRMKAWVHACGWTISLGTVGVERLWRNINRMTKNTSRSG